MGVQTDNSNVPILCSFKAWHKDMEMQNNIYNPEKEMNHILILTSFLFLINCKNERTEIYDEYQMPYAMK